jgi:hypothetical protein
MHRPAARPRPRDRARGRERPYRRSRAVSRVSHPFDTPHCTRTTRATGEREKGRNGTAPSSCDSAPNHEPCTLNLEEPCTLHLEP